MTGRHEQRHVEKLVIVELPEQRCADFTETGNPHTSHQARAQVRRAALAQPHKQAPHKHGDADLPRHAIGAVKREAPGDGEHDQNGQRDRMQNWHARQCSKAVCAHRMTAAPHLLDIGQAIKGSRAHNVPCRFRHFIAAFIHHPRFLFFHYRRPHDYNIH